MNKEETPKHIKWKGLKLKVLGRHSIFGTLMLKCPFCNKSYGRDGIQQHISAQARIEPYENMMGISKGLKHAIFFKKATELSKVQYFIRQWKE